MSLKHILVPLLGIDTDRPALDAALAVAKPHGAHIEALHVIADPLQSTPMLVGVGFAIAEAADVTRRHSETLAKAARETFEKWVRDHSLTQAELPPVANGAVSTQFVSEQEQELIRDPLIIHSRLTDLIVFAHARIKAVHEPLDHFLVDAGLLLDLSDEHGPAIRRGGICAFIHDWTSLTWSDR